jgi:AcrR family transcriptional regulator
MGEIVKGKRSEQARATRRRIIDGARELFLRQGYAATTLDQIAAQAGVAVQTVYFHFGNKRTVVKEIMDVLAVGDDEDVPMLARPWVQQVRDEPDGRRALVIYMRHSRDIFARIAPMMAIVRAAAGADPDMAGQWQTNLQQTLTAQRAVAEGFAAKKALRPGLSARKAGDIIFALVSLDTYLRLTAECGWTPAQWQRWTTATLADAILLDGRAMTDHSA